MYMGLMILRTQIYTRQNRWCLNEVPLNLNTEKLISHKSADIDEILAEFISARCRSIRHEIHKLIISIRNTEENIWAYEVEATGEGRKLNNVELDELYSSPNIVRVIKSRRMNWAAHVVRMGERRGVYRVLVGKHEGKDYSGGKNVDVRIIFKWIFRM
jgi:hypothetical protein